MIVVNDNTKSEHEICTKRVRGGRVQWDESALPEFRAADRQDAIGRHVAQVRTETVLEWAAAACSPLARHVRMRHVVQFARFQHAEDERHDVPPRDAFVAHWRRPLPYIYSSREIADLLGAAGKLRLSRKNPIRRDIYRMLIGLIAVTGLRKSEALELRIDVSPRLGKLAV